MESGIDTATIRVERQLARKARIIAAVSNPAMPASVATPAIAAFTKTDWSNSSSICMPGGAAARLSGSTSLRMALTTSSVEASPAFRMDSSTDRRPSVRTTFCCTAVPSRTCATSPILRIAPVSGSRLSGMSLSRATASSMPFTCTSYWVAPSLTVPVGSDRFCALTAFDTSMGVRPVPASLAGSMSTITWRILPP